MAVDLTDPVSSANASVVSSNIKTFGHAPDLVLETLMTDMVDSQRMMRQFNLACLARATSLVFDDTADKASDAGIAQITAKIADNTPPVYTDPVNYTNLAQIVASAVAQAITASLPAAVAAAK